MLISDSTTRALEAIAQRQRDTLELFTPGAFAERGDDAAPPAIDAVSDPLSVTAPSESFFMTAGAGGERLYSRDGRFAFHDGALVDASGHAVLGFSGGGATLAPLRANQIDVTLGAFSQPSIDDGGRVSYLRTTVEPETGKPRSERVIAGTLALARFPAATKLRFEDARHAAAPGSVIPHVGRAFDGSFAGVAPFTQQRSGIDVDRSLQHLQESYLAFDALRAANKAEGGVAKTVMDLLK